MTATGQVSCPPAGSFVAVSGQNFMAADTWITEQDGEYYAYGGRASFRNASQLPVADVVVTYWLVYTDDQIEEQPAIIGVARRAFVAPDGESVLVDCRVEEPRDGIRLSSAILDFTAIEIEIRFRDTSGVVWKRDRWGALTAQWVEV